MNYKRGLNLSGAALFAVFLTTALTGCADMGGLAPMFQPRTTESVATTKTLADVPQANWPATNWWKQLGDDALDALIRDALRDNPDLNASEARVRVAAAQADTAYAARLPSLDANARFPGSPFPNSFPAPNDPVNTSKQLTLNGSFALDLWGGKRAAWEAALGQQRAAEVDLKAAELTLSTRVAQAYNQLAFAFTADEIAKADVDRAKKLLDLTRQRVEAGVDALAQQRQAETTFASAQQKQAQTAQLIEAARVQLAVLLGQGPDRGLAIDHPSTLKSSELALPENLPAELIGRRPDIVAARWRVEAARRGIDAAKTQFYPNINLNGVFGFAAMSTDDLLRSTSRFGLLTPSISLPIFEGGRLRANLAGRDAEYDQAVAQYNKTLVTAFNEVAENLSQLRSLKAQLAAQQQALQSARQAWDLSTQRYRNGIGGYLEVLTVQQSLHQAEAKLAEIESRRVDASIALVRALGGGFNATAGAAAPTSIAQAQQ